jgi:nucleotide-binding universal stress UspA family protein
MTTVLVPLNETAFAESILPDARMLAGPEGKLILTYVVASRSRRGDRESLGADAERYLSNEAQLLQARGLHVETKVLVGSDIPRAIDEGVTELGADMVAVATYGMGQHERLARSSIAWKALAHSPVPILFRHAQQGQVRDLDEADPTPVKIMVPLDGSQTAERALPLAATLAAQWQGTLVLIHVSPDTSGDATYLDRIATSVERTVQREVRVGKPAGELVQAASDLGITHVVMTSHGRTGLSRVIAGDVAAELMARLSVPIIVIPSLAMTSSEQTQNTTSQTLTPPVGTPASN